MRKHIKHNISVDPHSSTVTGTAHPVCWKCFSTSNTVHVGCVVEHPVLMFTRAIESLLNFDPACLSFFLFQCGRFGLTCHPSEVRPADHGAGRAQGSDEMDRPVGRICTPQNLHPYGCYLGATSGLFGHSPGFLQGCTSWAAQVNPLKGARQSLGRPFLGLASGAQTTDESEADVRCFLMLQLLCHCLEDLVRCGSCIFRFV